MGRGLFGAILMAFVTIALISMVSSGIFRAVPDMPLRRKLLAATGICFVAAAIGLYFHGDVDYLIWLYSAPSRPVDEIAFVDRVQAVQAALAKEQSTAARSAACRQATAAIIQAASSVEDWGGTVSTTYIIGSRIVLVVRIGRYVQLRTAYNNDDASKLIDRDSHIFENAITLKSGDAIILSGASMPQSEGCLFDGQGTSASDNVDILFRFTKLKVAKG